MIRLLQMKELNVKRLIYTPRETGSIVTLLIMTEYQTEKQIKGRSVYFGSHIYTLTERVNV